MSNIFSFNQYTLENTYKVTDGKFEKQDWELHKDFYPEKFKMTNLTEETENEIFNTEKIVWLIKYKGNIISILSDNIDEQIVKEIFEKLSK